MLPVVSRWCDFGHSPRLAVLLPKLQAIFHQTRSPAPFPTHRAGFFPTEGPHYSRASFASNADGRGMQRPTSRRGNGSRPISLGTWRRHSESINNSVRGPLLSCPPPTATFAFPPSRRQACMEAHALTDRGKGNQGRIGTWAGNGEGAGRPRATDQLATTAAVATRTRIEKKKLD
jgi:hypothetical protein